MQVSRVIEAPAEKVWNLLVDTRSWSAWGPSVRAVDCRPSRLSGGLRGRVRTLFGCWVPFVVTRYEPYRCWEWRVAGVPATGHQLEELGGGRCRLIFTLPALLFPYALVCRRAAKNIARLTEKNGAAAAAVGTGGEA